MRFYLASWVGDGTAGNEYRPNVDAGAWAAIDLRPDPTVLEGRVLVGTDQAVSTLPAGVDDLGDLLDEALKRPNIRGIEQRLGVTLEGQTLRQIIAELLIVHGREDGTRWPRLKATRDGRHVVKLLRETIYEAPVVVGTTITDDFNRADNAVLGTSAEGWSWTEVVPDFAIVTNQARSVTNTHVSARAESDLASADHYAQADVTWGSAGPGASVGGTLVRFSTSAVTYYRGGWNRVASEDSLTRTVAGANTVIASQANVSPTGTATVLTEVSGSSVSVTVTPGPGTLSTTDTNITGNLRTGIGGFSQRQHDWDNFEAADLAAGQNIPVGQTVEAEVGQPITPLLDRRVTVSQTAEAETANPIQAVISRDVAVGQAAETETANPITPLISRQVAVGQASESETVNPITPVGAREVAVGQSSESETANAITPATARTIDVGQAVERELAQAITPVIGRMIPIGQATEAETGQSIAPVRGVAVGRASEVELARLISPVKPIFVPVQTAIERELARVITPAKVVPGQLGPAICEVVSPSAECETFAL